MAEIKIVTKEQACYYLGVSIYATGDEIKRAYREKVKLCHPDSGNRNANEQLFCLIQEAYEFLTNNKQADIKSNNNTNVGSMNFQAANTKSMNARPVKIFQTNTNAKKQFTKQKQVEKDREFLRQWEDKKKKELRDTKEQARKNEQAWRNASSNKMRTQNISPDQLTEQEALEKIRAIWLAETIHRQIEADKEKAELENRRKLYRAFMQQQMNDTNEIDKMQ